MGEIGSGIHLTGHTSTSSIDLSKLLLQTGHAVITTSLDGAITSWGGAAEALYGWRAEEVIGRSILEITPSSLSLGEASRIFEDLLQGRPWEGDFEVQHRNGNRFWVHVVDTPLSDEQGKIVGIVGVSRDISAEHRLREELMLSEDRTRRAGSLAGVGFWELDLSTRAVTCSQRLRDLFGFGQSPVTLEDVWSRIHPDDLAPLREQIQQAAATMSCFEFEGRVRRPDGSEVWLLMNGSSEPGRMFGVVFDITRRHQAEDTLRRTIAQLDDALALSKSYAFRWDLATDRVERSSGWQDILPLPESKCGGNDFLTLLESTAQDQLLGAIRSLSPSNPIYRSHYSVVVDGRRCQIEEIARGRFNSSGELTELIGVSTDVTAAHKLEQEFRESQEQLRQQLSELQSIYANAGVGLCYIDRDLRYRRINARLAEINGLPEADHLGRTVREVLPELADAVEPQFREIIETGKEVRKIEIVGVTPAQPGVTRTWVESWLPHHGPDGGVAGINVVAEEVTDQRRHQRMLQDTLERLSLVQNAAGIATWDWDIPRDHIVYSGSFSQLFGLPDGTELNLAQWQKLVHPDDRDRIATQVERCITERIRWSEEFRIIRPDGAVRWLLGRGEFLFDDGGRAVRALGINVDITDRRLQEQQLEAANRSLLQANQELGQFAWAVAHDLQEPARVISLYSQLITRERQDHPHAYTADLERYLDTIRNGAGRLQALLKDLLAFTHAGGETVERDWLDVDRIVQDTLEDLAVPIRQAQGQVQIGRLPAAKAARVHVQQLFQNLLSNAIKYRGSAPLRIEVGGERRGSELVYWVRDNGRGIEPEHHSRIFGVFRRLDKSIPGTGIGLAICAKIVARYHGRIWVASDSGKGATFYFTLPLE